MDPITEEEGERVSSVGMGGDEGAVSEDSEVFDTEEGDSGEQKQEGWCSSKPYNPDEPLVALRSNLRMPS